ncbi:hypothetical protein GCM10023340_07180 [Nocardioides marinquilinus]|uniref:J domain-containing protein n=1 Tax=Nocardioides marinquilinus TaxID=1210400 RepID=A0ABP9P9I0_9ACTN
MTPEERERAAERRRVARQHHPDLGGDPEAFVAAMAALERPTRGSGAATAGPHGARHDVRLVPSARTRRRRRWGAARRAVADGARRVRDLRLPGRRPDEPAPDTDPHHDPHH